MLQGETVVYQDLFGRNSLALQELPNVHLDGQKLLPFNLLARMDTSLSNWQRSTGITGVRFDLHPELQLRLPLGRSVFGVVSAAFRETAYGLTENEMSGGFRGTNPDGPEIVLPTGSSRELVELRADIGTALRRVFDVSFFGFDKLKHTIEPQLEYLYIPAVSQNDLPVFDGIDRINKRNLLTYGFASRLLGRRSLDDEEEPGRVYELARLSVVQSFAPDMRIVPVDGGSPGDHFSDIDFELRMSAGRIMAARLRSTLDTSETELSSAAIELGVREPAELLPEGKRPRLLTQMGLSFRLSVYQREHLDDGVRHPRRHTTDRLGLYHPAHRPYRGPSTPPATTSAIVDSCKTTLACACCPRAIAGASTSAFLIPRTLTRSSCRRSSPWSASALWAPRPARSIRCFDPLGFQY